MIAVAAVCVGPPHNLAEQVEIERYALSADAVLTTQLLGAKGSTKGVLRTTPDEVCCHDLLPAAEYGLRLP
jgi:hypothetical protein